MRQQNRGLNRAVVDMGVLFCSHDAPFFFFSQSVRTTSDLLPEVVRDDRQYR